MATSKDKTPEVEVVKPKRKKIKFFIFGAIALLIAAGGGAAYYYWSLTHKHEQVAAPPADPIFITLEPFTVNLQAGSSGKYLHAAVVVKVVDIESQAQITKYLPEVRSRVLTILNDRVPETLITTEAKLNLTKELKEVLVKPFAQNLAPPKVSSVMFTTFMIQ